MAPDRLRTRWILKVSLAVLAGIAASPASAASAATQPLDGAAPIALALAAAALGLVALAIHLVRRRDAAAGHAVDRIARLRMLLDHYESVLAGWREVTIIWGDGGRPRFFGQASAVLPPGRPIEAVLELDAWLDDRGAASLARAIEELRVDARPFDIVLPARDRRNIRVTGWPAGAGAALRLRPAPAAALPAPASASGGPEPVLAASPDPAYLRNASGRLSYANEAYRVLAAGVGRPGAPGEPPGDLMDAAALSRHLAVLTSSGGPRTVRLTLPDRRVFDLTETSVPGGSVGFLRPVIETGQAAGPSAAPAGHIGSVIDALTTPVAIFDARRELVRFNAAYAALWSLDPDWLATRPDEREILDRLRTAGQLPAEPNYQEWRDSHLQSYRLTAPRVSDPWHLPDGRTIVITAAPAGPQGGVIYVFEDMTARLELESRNRALVNVQRETLNALSEGVAVFGTNGRLTLSNPLLSSLWKLPVNELSRGPHIDRIAEIAAAAMPEDGAAIWRDLKARIVDLDPNRSDHSGRITRADGRLLDYALVRLPDGQTLITFLDVTESASYSRVLKERNEALVTADRLKDAFVQNVSYELRSPLTNIIGFADLLASGAAGALNERQSAYTGYIRASSETLGVLIDNILDLATVDAGIAELAPAVQDVAGLVEKARAGLAATFPEVDGERPLNLVVDIASELPVFSADGTRLVQILYNLLSNAARFSEPGGEVRLTVRPRGEHMLFIVEDQGAPMSEEARAAILGGMELGAGRQRGAGLALAIVRSFVHLHGGIITLEQRRPRGTRVTVSLPLDAGAAQSAAE